MNILFIAYSPLTEHAGGIQRVTCILSSELKNRGHNVYYLCGIKQNNEEVASYPVSFYMDKDLTIPYDKESKFLYLKYIADYQIDIVILQYPIYNKSLFFLKNTPKSIPIISCFHNQPFYKGMNSNLKNRLKHLFLMQKERVLFFRALKYSDKLCFLSEHFYSRLPLELRMIYHDKFVAINNPNTFSVKKNIQNKNFSLLIVCRLSEHQKNVRGFIDAWNILSKKNPDWKAFIVGDGPDRKFLENYAMQNNVKRLYFEGLRRNVSDYYAKARFICMTSVFEGWGMSLTEGMAYGCIPCAYGTYEAVYDIIDNNECGFIIKPFVPQEMADKIQLLINDEERLQSFAQKAQQKVQQFTPEKIVDQWENLLNELKYGKKN